MFDRFKLWGTITPSQSSSSETRTNTQKEIVEQANPIEKEGICSPLSNWYAEYRLGKRDRTFLEQDPLQLYEKAINFKKHQQELQNQGQNGFHIGFSDVDHQVVVLKTNEINTVDDLASPLEDSNHALLTYPKGKKDTHQVYIGKKTNESSENCVYFNVNHPGMEKSQSCREIYENFFKKIKKHTCTSEENKDQQQYIIIATSHAPVK